MKLRATHCLLGALALYALLCLTCFHRAQWTPYRDSGTYIVTARQLTAGHGYSSSTRISATSPARSPKRFSRSVSKS